MKQVMISLIKIDDEDFHDYKMPLNELLDFMSIERYNWKKLERTLDKLQVKQIVLNSTNQIIEKVTFLSYFKIDREEDTVLFRFDKTMKPLLLNLKNKFTQVDLKGILNFESSYTIRFYEIIKKYIGLQSNHKDKNYIFTYELEELKEIMVGDYDCNLGKIVYPKSYKRYNDFKRKVLLVAQKELKEKSNLYFEFEEQKTKRAVSHIKFTIIFKPKEQNKKEYQEYIEAESITHNIEHSNLTYEQYCKMKFRSQDFKTVEKIKNEYKDKPFFRPFVMKKFVNDVPNYYPWTLVYYDCSQDLYTIDGEVWNNQDKDINAINCFLSDYPQFLGQIDIQVKDLIGWSTKVNLFGVSKLGNEVDEKQSFKLIDVKEVQGKLAALFKNDNKERFKGKVTSNFIEKFKNDKIKIDIKHLFLEQAKPKTIDNSIKSPNTSDIWMPVKEEPPTSTKIESKGLDELKSINKKEQNNIEEQFSRMVEVKKYLDDLQANDLFLNDLDNIEEIKYKLEEIISDPYLLALKELAMGTKKVIEFQEDKLKKTPKQNQKTLFDFG
jgi:plasmid replication initiation protein